MREPGPYWTRLPGMKQWATAEWWNNRWFLAGSVSTFQDSDFAEIDERPITRQVWQPIEAAPRDGTHVLVHVGAAVEAYFTPEIERWESAYGGLVLEDPRGWMPLPPLPPRPEGE